MRLLKEWKSVSFKGEFAARIALRDRGRSATTRTLIFRRVDIDCDIEEQRDARRDLVRRRVGRHLPAKLSRRDRLEKRASPRQTVFDHDLATILKVD